MHKDKQDMPQTMLVEILATLLGLSADTIAPNARVADLAGYDSVQALRLISHLEASLGIRLDFERFYQAETLDQLAELLDASA